MQFVRPAIDHHGASLGGSRFAQGDERQAVGSAAYAPSHRAAASKPERRRGRGPLIALGVLLLVVVVAYGAGVVLFSNACYPNTVIADVDVSLMMRDTAVSRVKTSAEGYRLTIEGDGFTWQFDPESASEVIDAGAAVAAVIDGNEPFIWPARLVQALQSEPAEGAVKSTEGGEEDVELDDIALPDSFDRDAFLEGWAPRSTPTTPRARGRSTPPAPTMPRRVCSRCPRRAPTKSWTPPPSSAPP